MTLDNTKNKFLNIHFTKKVLIIWEGVWWCYSMSTLQLHLLPVTYILIMCSHLSLTNASVIFCSFQCFTPFSTQFFFNSVYTDSFTYRFFHNSYIWTHRPSTKSLPYRPLTWRVISLGTGLLLYLWGLWSRIL